MAECGIASLGIASGMSLSPFLCLGEAQGGFIPSVEVIAIEV